MLQTIYSIWNGLLPGTQQALIGALATLFAALLATIAVAYQIRKQAQHAIEQHKDNERLKLKLGIYEATLPLSTATVDANIELSTLIRVFYSASVFSRKLNDEGAPYVPPKARFPDYLQKKSDASEKVLQVI